ncbi:hypothetical protein [Bradyrhizobium neotropicale]|uniref:Uncharacterized protein n=1 Tax=Bradyrhizobium neotropicale TaxID=1497615 RepID=A0A176YWE4_9BRAD|nr:hypothetical protein [Bradyrhizobium neotropicale]OAF12040.1 hypothetical protein AXW67_20860 [Bradyrhizobium neotropicale]
MKTAIVTLSATILIAAAPAVLAKNVPSKAPHQHQVSKKHPASIYGYAPWRVMRANGMMTGYPGAFGGYAPGSGPKDYTIENSRNAGGGGGGGGGGGSGM